jgi:PPK2 family polyphosphate:nucleotide phosphotransferase
VRRPVEAVAAIVLAFAYAGIVPHQVRDRFRARHENGLVSLAGVDPDSTPGPSRRAAERELIGNATRLGDLQARFHAEGKRSLLIVLQALDTGGKDGTITHAMSGFNPQGTRVVNFKVPTPVEASHPFLWRIKRALPGPGEIVIFNRSHYEDVLVPRVRRTLPDSQIDKRCREINRFESSLRETGTTIVKLFLHISYDEQRSRLLQRLNDPAKRWKFAAADIRERGHWDAYQSAFDAAITATSTELVPWYIIPADHKWFRTWAVSHILIETLEAMGPQFPKPRLNLDKLIAQLEPQRTRKGSKPRPASAIKN